MPKIHYQLSDGTILGTGYVQTFNPGPDEAEVEYDFQVPPDSRRDFFKWNGANVVEKSKAEKDAILDDEKRVTPGKFMQKFNMKYPNATDSEKFLARMLSRIADSIREKDVD